MRLTRDEFLARIRQGLGRRRKITAPPPPPKVDEELLRLGPPPERLVGEFCEKAAGVGMIVHRTDAASLQADLGALLQRLAPARVAVCGEAHGAAMRAAAAESSAEVAEARGVQAMFDVDVGISEMAGAIAETGSMIFRSGPGQSRGVFLVPPVHVAVVDAATIVSDQLDWVGQKPEPMPAHEAWITGPSKTADIEGILVTGVHGPRVVHTLVVESAP